MNRVHRWGMIAAFLVILASGYFAVRTVFIEDKSATVPKMVGLQLVEAVDALQKEGLLAKVDRVESPLRADTVASQNIQGGEKIARGKVVVLRVSKGGALLPLPDVRGMKFEEGVGKLGEAGFKVSGVTRVTDKLRPAGTIIAQNPASPQEVSATTMISLLISSGPAEGNNFVTVPDLRAQSAGVAREVLEQSGLRVGKISESPSRDTPEGTILTTTPNRGARVQAGAQINLIVARKPNEEEVQTQPSAPAGSGPVRTVVIRETPDSETPRAISPDELKPEPAAPTQQQPAFPTKTAKLRYQVPPLTRPLPLKIEMSDGTGKKVLRDKETNGGEYVAMDVSFIDAAEITIYLGGQFVWQDKFK